MKEMKLMELAKLVNDMKVGDVIDFANGTEEDAERYGGWCGVKRIDEFSQDNPMYLVSHWGGRCECVLYQLDEYDPRIGDFCAERIDRYDNKGRYCIPTEKDWIECCARMIADYLEEKRDGVYEVITVDMEVGK